MKKLWKTNKQYRWNYAESKATVPLVLIGTLILVGMIWIWICIFGIAAIPD